MPDTCPLSARVAAGLAAPGSKLDAELSAHLPNCEACRFAVSDALRRWPTETAPLAEWLREGTNETTITPYQAERLACGAPHELELGPYLILDLIARGGMGAVYRAWHRLLRREDAVKTVRAEFAASSEAVRRFLREAEAAARLRHPNVVQVYTADRAGGEYYIAMELVNGPDLNRVVRSGDPLAPDRARDYIAQAADGLQSALDHGFVHRDMKPGNLLLAPGGVVKVADFGLARSLDPLRDDGNPTVPGAILGTPAYMSPEQARGERADTRSDVYALGCTLFFLLTGRTPFHAAQGIQLLYAHLNEPVPEVPAPPALGAIVRKCLEKRADDRYQTPGALAAALRSLDAPLAPTVVRPAAPLPAALTETITPGVDSTGGTTESVVAPPLPLLPQDEPRGPNPKVIIAVASLLLLLAAVAFVAMFGPKFSGTVSGGPVSILFVTEPPPTERPKIDAARVPKPVAKQSTPWKFVALVPAQDKEKVTAVGFLPGGEIVIARDGAKDDGSDSAWEVWAATPGAAPLRFRNRISENAHAKAVLVTDRALLTDRFERIDPVTLKGMDAFPHDVSKVHAGKAQMVECAALSGDGKYVAAGLVPEVQSDKYRLVVLWKTEEDPWPSAVNSGVKLETRNNDIRAVATDKTGDVTIAGTEAGTVERVTTSGKDQIKWLPPKVKGKADPVSAVAVLPSGARAFSAHTESDSVYGWDLTKPDPVQKIDLGWPVYRMCVSPDGRWLVAAGDAVAAIDLSTNPPEVHTLAEHYAGELRCAAFSADGKRLIVGGWTLRALPKDGVGVAWVWELK
jgi:serine/threonine protein kinase